MVGIYDNMIYLSALTYSATDLLAKVCLWLFCLPNVSIPHTTVPHVKSPTYSPLMIIFNPARWDCIYPICWRVQQILLQITQVFMFGSGVMFDSQVLLHLCRDSFHILLILSLQIGNLANKRTQFKSCFKSESFILRLDCILFTCVQWNYFIHISTNLHQIIIIINTALYICDMAIYTKNSIFFHNCAQRLMYNLFIMLSFPMQVNIQFTIHSRS